MNEADPIRPLSVLASTVKIKKQPADIIRDLANESPDTIVNEEWLAEAFGRNRASIRSAVARGELPAPTRLNGKRVWLVGAITDYLRERLARELEEQKRLRSFPDRLRYLETRNGRRTN